MRSSGEVEETGGTKRWLEAVLGFLYPPVCQLCQAEPAIARDGYVGGLCLGRVRVIREPYCGKCGLPFETGGAGAFECSNCRGLELWFDWARAAVVAGGVVLDVVHRYKYERQLWFETLLGGLLVEAAAPELRCGRWDMIIPVPLHAVKEREREFNQAARLAGYLGRSASIPVERGLVRRVRETGTQTRLARSERVGNMAGAFECVGAGSVRGCRVVLVDDVLTTGATTSECARSLREAGAEAVGVWTVARGL